MRLSHGLYEVCTAGIAANVGGTGARYRFFPSSPEYEHRRYANFNPKKTKHECRNNQSGHERSEYSRIEQMYDTCPPSRGIQVNFGQRGVCMNSPEGTTISKITERNHNSFDS